MLLSSYMPFLIHLKPLCLLLLVTISYATQSHSRRLTDWEQIHQTIHTYPLAIDSKNFELLAKVFTQDVQANYTGPLANVTSLSTLQSALAGYVSSLITQHQLGTTVIDIAENQTTANSTTYFTATLWSVAPATLGEFTILFGLYADDLMVVEGEGWRISKRDLVFMAPSLGNLTQR